MTISASRSQLVWSPVLGWVLLTCATAVAQAQDSTPAPAAQTLQEQTPQVDLPVGVPASGSGEGTTRGEVGIGIGAFTLYPSLDVQVGYDSNVFATPAPTSGSMYTHIRPALELRSDWIRHEVRVLANGGFGFYPSASSQNYQNYLFQFDGKLDIRYDFYATGMIAARRATEALGTPNTEFATAPTVVDTIPVEFNLYQRFNRFFYRATAAGTRYWYYDNSIITAGGLPAASRDRTEYEQRIRLGYEVNEDLALWVAPSFQQRIYDTYINAAGQARDSIGWGLNFGATWTVGRKTKLEGFIGYQQLSYIADGSSTPATVFGLSGSWNGYEPLTIRPSISRTINESAYSAYQNYVSTTVGVDFTYEIHDAWTAVGGTSINTADFNPAAGVANTNPRTDYYWKASLGLQYSFRPQLSIGPLYEHTTGWTSDPSAGGPQYSRDQFSIRFVAKR
ncbi:outer membrane beta-barrel protein [Reyranella massiliensis]|uniref:outer membrane beta-barrel protein n=1 Tax=Reyranella massiliensis TaxID=445220 RepID=UPI0015A610C2|nr:outer membrane beta-barrel protein [Reyranella massiliensis]